MIKISDEQIAKANEIISGSVRAAGYRLKIFPLSSDVGLAAGEKELAPTLAKLGFISKSNEQAERETKGSEMAIVVDIGPYAFKDERLGGSSWVKEGQIIKYLRYAGHQFEDPPGSGKVFRLINDEDVLGVYEETV